MFHGAVCRFGGNSISTQFASPVFLNLLLLQHEVIIAEIHVLVCGKSMEVSFATVSSYFHAAIRDSGHLSNLLCILVSPRLYSTGGHCFFSAILSPEDELRPVASLSQSRQSFMGMTWNDME